MLSGKISVPEYKKQMKQFEAVGTKRRGEDSMPVSLLWFSFLFCA